jgi:release factor glutamine methyltransferase
MELASRRAKGEPVAMLLGAKEFYGRMFGVDGTTLTPRPDSETIIEAALATFPDRKKTLRILDMGTGTGCLLLTLLAKYENASGIGIDLSIGALSVARRNMRALSLSSRAKFMATSWREMESMPRGPFDIVVSNPPYIKTGDIARLARDVREFEPRLALDGGPDGLAEYRAIAAAMSKSDMLGPASRLFLEIGKGQAAAVKKIFTATDFGYCDSFKDLSGITRVLEFERLPTCPSAL